MKKNSTLSKLGVQCLFVLLLCINPFFARAHHMAVYSEEITYSHTHGDSVKITVTVYRPCTGLGIDNYPPDILVSPEKSKSFTVSSKHVSTTAVTSFLKKGECTQCTNSSCNNNLGIQKVIFEGYVDLKNYSDCQFTFSTSAYTRIISDVLIYSPATLNRCADGYKNSPVFDYEPISILCKNQCMSKMHSASASAKDSLVYDLVPPMELSTTTYSYYPTNFTYLKPISVATNGSCSGFTLNNHTGKLTFMPTTDGDVSPMAIEVSQYHPDSTGKMVKIGSVIRDFTFLIVACPTNTAPTLTSGAADVSDFFVCAGNEVNIKFYTGDADQGDTVNIAYTLSMKNATFSTTTNKIWNTGTFNWIPQESDIQKAPHEIMLTAYDNKGPFLAKTEKVYRVFVVAKRPQLSIIQKDKGCGLVALSISGSDTSVITNYTWHINGKIINAKNADFQATNNGDYIIKLFAMNKAGCESIYLDTVHITDLPKLDLGNDTAVCAGSAIVLNTKSASKAYKYKWQSNPTLSSDTVANPKVQPKTDQLYVVEVTDAKGCKSIDSVKVEVQNLVISISKDTLICKNQVATLQVHGPKNTVYSWSPSVGLSNPNDSVIKVFAQTTTTYTLTAKNASGCVQKDSVIVKISTAKANAGNDVTICKGDSTLLSGSGGYYYQWTDDHGVAIGNTASVYVKPNASAEYTLIVNDTLKCISNIDKVLVNVKAVNVSTSPDTTICAGDTIKLQITGGHLYNWLPENTLSGNSSATPTIFPLTNTTYHVQIQDTIKGCFITKAVNVTVNKDCVWPGDANKDGIVNYKDVLYMGLAYASTGLKRNNATTDWKPQATKDWFGATADGINYKHMDANGNGEVMDNDISVVRANYAKTFYYTNIPYTIPQNGKSLYIDLGKDTFYAGDTVLAKVYLGSATNPFSKLYGAALQYELKSNVIVNNSQQVNTGNAFFTPDTSESLSFVNLQNNGGEVSISRTNTTDVSGYGKMTEIMLVLKDTTYNYASTGEKIKIQPTDALVIDRTGTKQDVFISGDSAIVMRKRKEPEQHIGIKEQSISSQLHIYPNPTNNIITIESAKYLNGEIYITNALGQVVEKINVNNQRSKTIDLKHFSPGIYMVQLISSGQVSTQKLIIYK